MKTLILIFVLLTTTCLYSTIINVPGDQPTIQEGIVAAADTDTVLVADGIYFENIDFIGKAITVASNFLIDADPLHIENTIINGSQPTNPDYGSCVRFMSNEDSTSVLTGFYLTQGTGTFDPGFGMLGGGILCKSSSPKIVSNIVKNNTSDDYVGGIVCYINCSPILLNNMISYNTAVVDVGGVSLWDNCDAYVEGNIISNNTAENGCGGLLISNSSPTLVGNTIRDNSALTGSGGGVHIQEYSSPILLNNIICNNIAGLDGGGIEILISTPVITNCTIYDNEALGCGSQIDCWSGGATVVNSIIGGNTTSGSVYFNTSAPTFNYCDFYNSDGPDFYGPSIPANLGVITTVNNNGDPCDEFLNIFLDPLFVDPANDDFHLTEFSPCIDAGSPESLPDPDGSIVDIGRFYFEPPPGTEDNTIVQTKDYLHQNYPNPFNPTTTISYQLPENSEVELTVYNLKGQKVKTLVNDNLESGDHTVVWNGTDENNKSVSNGIYFYKMKTDNYEETKKMILMK